MKVLLFTAHMFLFVIVVADAQPSVLVAYSENFPQPPYPAAKYLAPDLGRALMCYSLTELPRSCKKFFFPIVFTAYTPVDEADSNLVKAISIEADKAGVFAVLLDEGPPEWAAKYLPAQLPALDSTGFISKRGYGIVCVRGGTKSIRIGIQ